MAAAITFRAERDRDPERLPALLVSGLLHAGLLAAAFLTLNRAPKPLPIPLGEAVPVSIVTKGPPTPATVKGPTETHATAEEPEPSPEPPSPPAPAPAPEPTPAPAPPRPAPAPPPPRPAPVPKPAPRPVARRTPDLNLDSIASSTPRSRAKPRDDLDLSSIASSVPSRHGPSSSSALDLSSIGSSLPRGSAAARGPDRAATSSTAHASSGSSSGLSPLALAALRAKIRRLWSPNCEVDGANSVVVKIALHLSPGGGISSAPQLVSSRGSATESVVEASAQRALSAIRRGAPYTELPPSQYSGPTGWHDLTLTFDKPCE